MMKTARDIKKIGIVTIDDYTNYGNRLQNYALTKLLEERFQVINGIRFFIKSDWEKSTNSRVKQLIRKCIPFIVIKKYRESVFKGTRNPNKRESKFWKFTSQYTLTQASVRNRYQAKKKLEKYGIDYFVAGSDQVWNPYWHGTDFDFLTFTPKEKRLSFAASIGVDDIPASERERYKRNLMDMRYISVREKRAAEIVKELTGRDADITLDPTLLLDKAEWERVARKPEALLEDKYICTYFLGDVPEAVDTFAAEKGLKIRALNSENDMELYTIDPAEFLYVIKNAEYVLTDSFHAVAFSIKFNKEFYVFRREGSKISSMFSRIETITQRFGLENRIQDRENIVEQSRVDSWDSIEDELMKEREKSIGKLCEMMED